VDSEIEYDDAIADKDSQDSYLVMARVLWADYFHHAHYKREGGTRGVMEAVETGQGLQDIYKGIHLAEQEIL
jgi:hypothetical protein